MKWLRDGLSIDEARFSVMIVLLVGFSGVACYSYLTRGDITSNMVQVLFILVSGITTVNIAQKVFSGKSIGLKDSTPINYENPVPEDNRGASTI